MTEGMEVFGLSAGHVASNPVIRDASAKLGSGRLGCMVGRNGVGKSTLLETIAGLRAPFAGRVRLDGVDPHAISAPVRAGLVGYLPQADVVPRGLSALDYVLLARRALQGPWPFDRDEDVAAAHAALEACCADPLADRRLGAMSGGELQRVRLAQAMVGGARFLLLDEPSSHLDPRHRIETFALLRGLVDRGITALVVTHDLDLATGCDAAWLIGADGALTSGSPDDVLTPEALGAAFGVPFQLATAEGRKPIPVPMGPTLRANARRREP
ncbi:MAG: hypothetical protein RIS21_244 [Planctomycetota bacterium]|jgi:ABC-type cobalamin/Fe3+-siderophores transport system ATPase subunit